MKELKQYLKLTVKSEHQNYIEFKINDLVIGAFLVGVVTGAVLMLVAL